MLINIDSQIPNEVVFHALQENKIKGFEDLSFIKKEKTYKRSRFDIYYERKNGKKGFMEIKGVTLENEGFALFPDAPTRKRFKAYLRAY
jgi:sugar fermentation stimulation protein A